MNPWVENILIQQFHSFSDYQQVDEKRIFNDAKNLVFASIMFEKVGIKNYIKKAFDYCHEMLLFYRFTE